jgi:hypothetical protein
MKILDKYCIATQKIYTTPTYADYDKAKDIYLKNLDAEYDKKSVKEKWAILIKTLQQALEEKHMPDALTKEKYKTSLNQFKEKRENASKSVFNLQIEQCVNYFEIFCFSYATTDDNYKLSDNEKIKMLQSIQESMAYCETGINGRFYTAVQDSQKSTDWMATELAKFRCATLRILHGNFDNYGTNGQDVHEYNALVTMANKKHLGIPVKEEVADIHAGMVNHAKLESFFEANYRKCYAKYEKDILTYLSNHCLTEMSEILEIDSKDWENGELSVNDISVKDIDKFISGHFPHTAKQLITETIISEDEAKWGSFKVKKKQDVEKVISSLIIEKLLHDQYCISIEDILINDQKYSDINLPAEVSLITINTMHKAFKDNNAQAIIAAIDKTPELLKEYPILALNHLETHSSILKPIPAHIKNHPEFIKESITVFNKILQSAINNDNEDALQNAISQIFDLIGTEHSYLQHLSTEVLNHKRVAEILVEKDGIILGYLSDALQNDTALKDQAVKQNPQAQYFIGDANANVVKILEQANSILTDYEKTWMELPPCETTSKMVALQYLLSMQAIKTLLDQEKFSHSAFIEHTKNISPDILLKIIERREKNNLKPLPFFDNKTAINNLAKFNQEIKDKINDEIWQKPYSEIKQQAYEEESYGIEKNHLEKNALNFITTNSCWFNGFKQYCSYNANYAKLYEILQSGAHAFYTLFVIATKLALCIALLYYGFPILTQIVDYYFDYLAFSCLILWLTTFFIENQILATIVYILWRLIFLDIDFMLTMILCIIVQTCYLFLSLFEVYKFFTTLSQIMINSWYSDINNKGSYIAETLEETCKNTILRLECIYEESAQEKASILKDLIEKINTDEEPLSFKDKLRKKYAITFNGSDYEISFSEVSAIRRKHLGHFSLDNSIFNISVLSFFGMTPKTTTTEVLAACESAKFM